jgi:hypothetical protein
VTVSVVRHPVRDYSAWRKVYDSVAPLQKAGGVIEESVYQQKENPDDVLVLHRFATRAQADAFFASDELHAALDRAGVGSPLRIEFWEEAT